MLKNLINAADREDGHATPGLGTLIGAAGAILLAVGAAGETDWLTITGGIVLAVGVLVAGLLHHVVVDYDIFARIETLEGKDPASGQTPDPAKEALQAKS